MVVKGQLKVYRNSGQLWHTEGKRVHFGPCHLCRVMLHDGVQGVCLAKPKNPLLCISQTASFIMVMIGAYSCQGCTFAFTLGSVAAVPCVTAPFPPDDYVCCG